MITDFYGSLPTPIKMKIKKEETTFKETNEWLEQHGWIKIEKQEYGILKKEGKYQTARVGIYGFFKLSKKNDEIKKMKTLKDINYRNKGFMQNVDSIQTFKDNLREEAMNWVKNLDNDIDNIKGRTSLEVHQLSSLIATSEWIKLFFNIRDEDMKGD